MQLTLATCLLGLSSLVAANPLQKRQTSCDQAPTNFQIYANATGTYGQLGGPCYGLGCGVFFSVSADEATTFYSINTAKALVIAADSQPHAAGLIAYADRSEPNDVVQFGRRKQIEANKTLFRKIRCSIADSEDGDGSCDLLCTSKGDDGVTVGDSINTENYNQWNLGYETEDTPVQIKVVF
jgi:hypothetical protein